jgi:hypothetical protein
MGGLSLLVRGLIRLHALWLLRMHACVQIQCNVSTSYARSPFRYWLPRTGSDLPVSKVIANAAPTVQENTVLAARSGGVSDGSLNDLRWRIGGGTVNRSDVSLFAFSTRPSIRESPGE